MIIGTVLKIALVRKNIWSDGWIIINDYDGEVYGYATNDVIEGKDGEYLAINFTEGFNAKFKEPEFSFFDLDYNNPIILNMPFVGLDGTTQQMQMKIIEYCGMDDDLVEKRYNEYLRHKEEYKKHFNM